MLVLVASAFALVPHGSVRPCATLSMREDRLAGVEEALPPARAAGTGLDTEHFHIEGKGYTPTDAEMSALGDIFEVVWAKEIDEMGYLPPHGEGLFSVYLQKLGNGLYGYTSVERDGVTPYIVLNSDMSWTGETTEAANQVTAAHEFFHAVQFVYDYYEDAWWMEASSTWMEDEVYDSIDDYDYYLSNDQWPDYPEVSMVASDGWHEYGEVIWPRYITTFYGGADVEKTLWEACDKKDSLAVLQDFFGGQAEFEAALLDFEIRNALDYAGYEEGKDWYPVYTNDLASKQSDLPVTATPTEYYADYLGVNYWKLKLPENTPKSLVVDFSGGTLDDGTKVRWQVSVVGRDGSTWNTVTENTKDTVSLQLDGIGTDWHEAWVLVGILSENTGVDHDKYDSARNYTEVPPTYTFTASLAEPPPEDTGTVDTGDTGTGDTGGTPDSGNGGGKRPPGDNGGGSTGCGCATGGGAPGAGVLLLAALGARRSRRSRS